jgi:ribose transport system substrate-binding protein
MIRMITAVVGVGVLLAALLGGGCGKKDSDDKRPKVGFLMTLDHPYWQNMRKGAKDEAEKLGMNVTILNAKEDPVRQIQQIREIIAKQVDIVCLVPMKKEPLVRGVEMLNKAGIPVIVVNREVDTGCKYICYTGTDTYAGAVVSAKILVDAIGGKGQIVEFHQHLGTGPELARSKALKDLLKDYPEIKVVERIAHEGKPELVKTEMQTLLQKYPKLVGVYAHGDVFSIAAGQVCRKSGRDDIKIVGMGGSQEAIDAIKSGLMTGTSYQQPEEEGRSAIRLAKKYLDKEKLEKNYPVSCPAITKENAHKFKGQF